MRGRIGPTTLSLGRLAELRRAPGAGDFEFWISPRVRGIPHVREIRNAKIGKRKTEKGGEGGGGWIDGWGRRIRVE